MIPEPPQIYVSWFKVVVKGEWPSREIRLALRFVLLCKGITMLMRPLIAYICLKLWLM
jgi:hypothetical protein